MNKYNACTFSFNLVLSPKSVLNSTVTHQYIDVLIESEYITLPTNFKQIMVDENICVVGRKTTMGRLRNYVCCPYTSCSLGGNQQIAVQHTHVLYSLLQESILGVFRSWRFASHLCQPDWVRQTNVLLMLLHIFKLYTCEFVHNIRHPGFPSLYRIISLYKMVFNILSPSRCK